MAINFNTNPVKSGAYNGKNLQPIIDWSERTINNVTCRIENGVGYLNGTSSAGSWLVIETTGAIVLPAGTYTIYFWTNFVHGTGQQLITKIGLGLRSTNHPDLYKCNQNKYTTFTLTQQESFNIIFWWEGANMVFDNIYIKSMVTKGEYNSQTIFDPLGLNNDIKRIVKDGAVRWCKPYTARVNDVDNGDIRILNTEEPSAQTATAFTNGTVFYGDRVMCTWKGGTESVTTSVPPLSSITAPVLTDAFSGHIYCTVKNNNIISAKYYWYTMYQGTRSPATGYNEGLNSISPGGTVTIDVGSVKPSSGPSLISIYVFFELTVEKTDTLKVYGPDNTNAVTGLTDVATGSSTISSTLRKYTATGYVKNDTSVVVNSTYSESSPSPYQDTVNSSTTSLDIRAH